jgi:hypothetical protein
MVLAAIVSFNFSGKMIGLFMSKIERKFKAKKLDTIKNNWPETVMYQSAINTNYEATGISHQS